jgi:hypothetical protein
MNKLLTCEKKSVVGLVQLQLLVRKKRVLICIKWQYYKEFIPSFFYKNYLNKATVSVFESMTLVHHNVAPP